MTAIQFQTALALGVAAVLGFGPGAAHAQAPTVVALTQVACQFVEPEGGDRAYAAASKDECDALNARTTAGRFTRRGVHAPVTDREARRRAAPGRRLSPRCEPS